ncbi:MAG: hypothetical protein ABGZ35_03900 [Planctomycetaceae bacterium]
MSSTLAIETVDGKTPAHAGARRFGVLFATLTVSVCALAGLAPLGFSIVAVFLFAGPHNWMEARFFLSRMPMRWGRLRAFYLVGFAGVLLLFAGSLMLPAFGRQWQWGRGEWLTGIATWNTVLVSWILIIVAMRRRETGEERWAWVLPAGLALIGVNWIWPLAWSLALVYLHPLVALWYLDRELGRGHREWQVVYRRCLPAVPLLLGLLGWLLAAG